MEFILPIFPILGRGVYTPRYSQYWVMEFILPIFPILGRGVYTPDIPRTGSWSLYSRYSPYGVVEFAPCLPGGLGWSSETNLGWMPFLSPPLTVLGFEPMSHCDPKIVILTTKPGLLPPMNMLFLVPISPHIYFRTQLYL